jgi:hypothetical protein
LEAKFQGVDPLEIYNNYWEEAVKVKALHFHQDLKRRREHTSVRYISL